MEQSAMKELSSAVSQEAKLLAASHNVMGGAQHALAKLVVRAPWRRAAMAER